MKLKCCSLQWDKTEKFVAIENKSDSAFGPEPQTARQTIVNFKQAEDFRCSLDC